MLTLLIGIAGSFGAVARFGVDDLFRRRWPTSSPLPTLVINVSGSLLLGVLTGIVLYRGGSTDLKLVLGTGFCGGYTTFSTASFEIVRLAQRRSFGLAVGNGLATVLLTLGAGALGIVAMR